MTGRQGTPFGLPWWLENVQCKKSVFKEKTSPARERREDLKADLNKIKMI
jgi:hypothetical protein